MVKQARKWRNYLSDSESGDFMKKTREQGVNARQQLLDDLHQTKNALEAAYSNFENVIDPDLIDCYTYEIYAVQKRYKFLLEQARQMDLQAFF